jgi:hypothetical protein
VSFGAQRSCWLPLNTNVARFTCLHQSSLFTVAVLQAARVYFAMVAIGSFLYVFIFLVLPQQHKQYYKASNSCGELMLASWLGSGLHLAVLLLLPEQQYVKHRTFITLALRVVYLLGTARYYGQCHVGRASTHEVHGTAQVRTDVTVSDTVVIAAATVVDVGRASTHEVHGTAQVRVRVCVRHSMML